MAARPWIRVYPQEPNDAIQPVRANPGPRNMPRRNAQPIAYFYLMFSRVNPGIPGHGSIPDLTTESLILFIISRTLVVVCY